MHYSFRQRLFFWLGLNAALIVLLLAGWLSAPRSQPAMAILPSPQAVRSIHIAGDDAISLLLHESAWYVERDGQLYPADSGRISAFLASLAEPVRPERVADGPAAWPGLGLDDRNAVLLELRGERGELVRSFRLGNYAQGVSAVYLALDDSPVSWRFPAVFASYLRGAANLWYDLRSFPGLHPTLVQTLQVNGRMVLGDGQEVVAEYRLQRQQDGWVLVGQTETRVDRLRVEALLRSWAGLRAREYLDWTDPLVALADDQAAGLRLRAWLADGSEQSIHLRPLPGTDLYLGSAGHLSHPLLLNAWAIRESVKDLDSLLEQ